MSDDNKKHFSKEALEIIDNQNAEGSFQGESQHFSRIKKIYAKDGFVFVSVYPRKATDDAMGKPLKDQMFSIREAAARAKGLNAMAHKFPQKDRDVAMEIVDNVIAACKEAQTQAEAIVDGKGKPIITQAPIEE